MGDAAREARKVQCLKGADITNGSIDHKPGDTHRLSTAHHDLADKTLLQISATIDYEDIAGTKPREGLVQSHVVPRPRLYGYSRADQAPAGMVRAQRPRAMQSIKVVGRDRNCHLAELTDNLSGK